MPKTLENSNTRLLISEILRKVSNAKTKKEKVSLLQKHNSTALRQLMVINFEESIKEVFLIFKEFLGTGITNSPFSCSEELKNWCKSCCNKICKLVWYSGAVFLLMFLKFEPIASNV